MIIPPPRKVSDFNGLKCAISAKAIKLLMNIKVNQSINMPIRILIIGQLLIDLICAIPAKAIKL